jgi:hypothetical protein
VSPPVPPPQYVHARVFAGGTWLAERSV